MLLSRIAAEIPPAVAAVEAFWGTDWPSRIVVEVAGSDQQFTAAAGSSGQWADVAAVTVATAVDTGRRLAAGQRIVFAPESATMTPDALRIVLGHELFHYASRADTAVDAPRWLTEGVADFVARTPAPSLHPPDLPLALPTDADLDTSGTRRAEAYDRAWWFARFVADDYGASALRELYLAACGPGHVDPPTALRWVLGDGPPGVLARWQRWLTSPA